MTQSQGKPIPGRLLAAIALLLAALAACAPSGAKDPGDADLPVPVERGTPEPESEPELAPTWPLTGVQVEPGAAASDSAIDASAAARPVLSVKIENSAQGRPQAGLSHADVVWEQLVEGGMTRFVAMFHSDLPQTLGPIRSVRPMDAAIAAPAGGLLVFSGGHSDYQERAQQAGLVLVREEAGDNGFYRDPSRGRDHGLFGYPEQLRGHGAGLAGPAGLFEFSGVGEQPAATGGREVRRVDVHFPASSPSWEWDGESWQRFESGLPAHTESGARLGAQNVVVVRVEIRDTGRRDSAGSMVPETILTGGGEAVVFSAGHMIAGTWEKGADPEPLMLRGVDGGALTLAPGKTWVELVPLSGASVSASP